MDKWTWSIAQDFDSMQKYYPYLAQVATKVSLEGQFLKLKCFQSFQIF